MSKKRNRLGKIICFEGIDGSGKGEQSKRLYEHLQAEGYRVLYLDFPNYEKGFFGKQLGTLLAGEEEETAKTLSPKTISLWYALDRYERFKTIDLTAYDYVVMNRSSYSNIGYQLARLPETEQSEMLAWLMELEFEQLSIPKPDYIFYCAITSEMSDKNTKKKEAREYLGGKAQDVYEGDSTYLEKTEVVYERISRQDPNVHKIQCMTEDRKMRSRESIAEEVYNILQKGSEKRA